MKTFTETLVAGVRTVFNVPGKYFHLISSAYPLDFELISMQGKTIGEKATAVDAGTWTNESEQFSAVVITSALAQQVKFAVSYGQSGVFRVAGEVSVIDGGKARTIAGVAFMRHGTCAGVGAQYSHVQLLNPAASGKRVILEQFWASQGGTANISVTQYDTSLTTFVGNGKNKLLGGAASAAEIRAQNNGAILGAGPNFAAFSLLANTTPIPRLTEPVVILEGQGVIVQHDVVNLLLIATFEWFEETI